MKRNTPLKRKTPLKRTRITTKKPMKRKSRLNPVSKNPKVMEKNKMYKALRSDYMRLNPICEYVAPDGSACPQGASDIHHKAGRAQFHNRVDTWMAVCRHHHEWIHQHPKESKKAGHLINPITQQLIDERKNELNNSTAIHPEEDKRGDRRGDETSGKDDTLDIDGGERSEEADSKTSRE